MKFHEVIIALLAIPLSGRIESNPLIGDFPPDAADGVSRGRSLTGIDEDSAVKEFNELTASQEFKDFVDRASRVSLDDIDDILDDIRDDIDDLREEREEHERREEREEIREGIEDIRKRLRNAEKADAAGASGMSLVASFLVFSSAW